MTTITPVSTPSRSAPSLCCGLCNIKTYKRGFLRNFFRRTQRRHALRKTSDQRKSSEGCPRAALQSLEIESLSIEREGSSRMRYHGRKGSVISFGDVDTKEVHRMMKFINKTKVKTRQLLSLVIPKYLTFANLQKYLHMIFRRAAGGGEIIFPPAASDSEMCCQLIITQI